MSTEKQKQQTEPVKPETQIVYPPDFKLLYVNHIQSTFTTFDLSFSMGEAVGVEGDKFIIQAKARVTMSPVEAKIFLKILTDTIKNFESQVGTIVVPTGMGV